MHCQASDHPRRRSGHVVQARRKGAKLELNHCPGAIDTSTTCPLASRSETASPHSIRTHACSRAGLGMMFQWGRPCSRTASPPEPVTALMMPRNSWWYRFATRIVDKTVFRRSHSRTGRPVVGTCDHHWIEPTSLVNDAVLVVAVVVDVVGVNLNAILMRLSNRCP